MNRFLCIAAVVVVAVTRTAAAATAAIPTLSPGSGTYNGPQTVTISDVTPGAKIYFTTNGSAPPTTLTLYTGPITIGPSTVGRSTYTMQAATPAFKPAAGTYGSPRSVSISDATPGAQIYFTTDGTTPTTSSTPYTGPGQVRANTTRQAIAAAIGYSSSAIAVASYTITPYLTSIAVTAPSATVHVGSSLQCAATGTYSDGGTADITTQVAWTTSDPGVATITSTGLLTGAGGGTTSVAATQGSTAGSLAVTVQAQQAAFYCYDFQGRLTASLPCPVGQDCSASCPR